MNMTELAQKERKIMSGDYEKPEQTELKKLNSKIYETQRELLKEIQHEERYSSRAEAAREALHRGLQDMVDDLEGDDNNDQ